MTDEIQEYIKKRAEESDILREILREWLVKYKEYPHFKSVEDAQRQIDEYLKYKTPRTVQPNWKYQGDRYFTGSLVNYNMETFSGTILSDLGHIISFTVQDGIKVIPCGPNGFKIWCRDKSYPTTSKLKFKIYGEVVPEYAQEVGVVSGDDILKVNEPYRVHLASDPYRFVDVYVEPMNTISEELEAAAEKAAPTFAFNDQGHLQSSVTVVVEDQFIDVEIKQTIVFEARKADDQGRRVTARTNHIDAWESYKASLE